MQNRYAVTLTRAKCYKQIAWISVQEYDETFMFISQQILCGNFDINELNNNVKALAH